MTAVLDTPVVARPGGGRKRGRTRDRGLIVFALPSVIWYVIFTIGPLVAMFVVAFMDWAGLAAPASFNGGENLDRLFGDERILTALKNTAVHMVVSLPIIMVGAFMLGYFLNLKLPGHRILRVIMFVPALISLSAMGMLFVAVLGPTGLVNSALDEVGLGEHATAWLADPAWAMPSLILVTIWSGLGFTGILFAARLSAIDNEIYAAAELDGANHWQKMWRVAYPIARDYFGVLTMLQYLWTLFGSAGMILLLTRGGPGESTSTLSWLVYRFGFRSPDVGYSQTIGLVLFVLGIVGLVIIRRVFRARY
ncbi:carbohydrate ABC transporter membrane protein 1 (CUT1 family) [Asanoa ferruginea]|uniref:Carbohydrate ABC transporter membrane protein 1 (CUT1 family) n=1 Tax=Asanoa ferruginea TaxID=53367 RepID=A0A3D9ZVP6_9ACTN|nr:sugar ABC transporter permease [Asanoa ferruginea]REG00144.1 carbohydrate ABC transporter membrane protein 1 (CUT1 family) [Asanoa ferruginea]GIF46158.1 transporter [Asanoa ferruginea]